MNNHEENNNKEGFTLIEILVVVALIAILATITFIAINPARNFRDTRNAQRSSDVLQILNAVTQYTSEQGNDLDSLAVASTTVWGTGLTALPLCSATPAPIGTTADVSVDISAVLVPDYIVGIPSDPSVTTAPGNTGYTICEEASGRVTVAAPNAESTTISVSR